MYKLTEISVNGYILTDMKAKGITNYFLVKENGAVSMGVLSKKAADFLKSEKPKGCPYNNYTLQDLLWDLIKMYDWKMYGFKVVLISDFIRLLQSEGNSYACMYGDKIISCTEL